MKNELKNMTVILNIGSILLFFAGIGIIFTLEISPILRFIGSLTIGLFSFFFSFFVSNILKIDSSSKLLHYLSVILIIVSYIYGGFSDIYGIFNISENMTEIFLASIYLLMVILSSITVVRYKNYNLLHFTFIALFLTLFHILSYYDINFQIGFIVIGLIILFITLLKNIKVKNFFLTFSYIYIFLCIILGYTDNFYYSSILFGINMLVLFNALYKGNCNLCELISLFYIIVSIFRFGRVVYLNFDLTIAYLLIAFSIGILELFIYYYKAIKGNINKLFYKIVFSLIYFILVILTFKESVSTLLPIAIFMLLSSIGTSHFLKSDKDYFIGIKIFVLILAILLNIDTYLVNINEIMFIYILGIVGVLMYIIFNNKIFKVTSLIISLVILFPLVILTKDSNIIFYVATCLYIILNIVIYLNHDDFIDKSLKNILYSIYCYVLFVISTSSAYTINYLIISVILLIILILNNQDKVRYVVTLIFLFLIARGGINYLAIKYTYLEDFSIILKSLLFLIVFLLFNFNCIEKKNMKTNMASVAGSLVVLEVISQYDSWSVILYSLLISLVMLVVGILDKENKSMYVVGVIFTIICLVKLLSNLRGIPVIVYLIVISVVLITIISIMIIRFNRNPHIIIDDNKNEMISSMEYKDNYCGSCGKKVSLNDTYCGECGNNLKGSNNYCSQCGRKILKGENFCENCGKRIEK